MALVPVSKSGSALMSDLIEADKKHPRHGEGVSQLVPDMDTGACGRRPIQGLGCIGVLPS